MAKKAQVTISAEVVAEKIEEVALTLATQADILRKKAEYVRQGKIHHANEAISTICQIQGFVNINVLVNAMITQKREE